MEGGPPVFPADSTCPQVLWIQLVNLSFRLRDYHSLRLHFPLHSTKINCTVCCPNPKCIATPGLASSGFARRYSRNRVCFLFLRLLRCFSSAGSPRKAMYSLYDLWLFTIVVSQFGNLRVDAYLQLTAAYRSLSRPSSAPDAKAFALCSWSLLLLLNCLSYR